jgi:hypothetical protein
VSDGDIVGREVRGMRGCRGTGVSIGQYTPWEWEKRGPSDLHSCC